MSYPPAGQPDQSPPNPYGQQPGYPPPQPGYPLPQPGYPPPQPGYPPPADPYAAQQQAYSQYAMPQMGTPNGATVATKSNPLAITSLVLGIVSLPFLFLPYLGIFVALAGIITGHISLRQIKRDPVFGGKRGMGITGLVLSYIGFVINLLLLGAVVAALIFISKNPQFLTPMPTP